MTNLITAACVAAAFAAATLPYIRASAAYSTADSENTVYRGLLLDTVEHFGLSDTSASSDLTFIYGAWDNWYCVCIWDGYNSYRTQIDMNQEIPVSDYYESSSYICNFNTEFIGAPYIARFFYQSGQYYYMHSVWTTNPGNYNSIQDQSRAHFLLQDEAGDTIGEQVRYIIDTDFPETVEPTSTTTPVFSLPENWVNSVEKTEPTFEMYTETIPSMTVPTLPEDVVSKTMLLPQMLFDILRGTWLFPIFIFCVIVSLLTYFIWLK